MNSQETATKVAEIMWQLDHAARGLGITLEAVGSGTATLVMPVREDMVNGHGTCHGAFIFAIADAAFAYACNSDNHRAVAAAAGIDFLAPVHLGDVLTAHAMRRQQGGRNGLYDVEVTNQHGQTVALFRGRSVRVKGHFFDPA